MQKRLVVLLGSSFGENLIKGLVRNRYSVLWHHEGSLGGSFRAHYSGIDWVCTEEEQNKWSPLVSNNVEPQKDRWIVATKSAHGPFHKSQTSGLSVGFILWPVSLRQLIRLLNVQSHEGDQAFHRVWKTNLDEWRAMEDAKKTIMSTMNCTEPEAYRHLRRLSMDKCKPIAEIAQNFLKQ